MRRASLLTALCLASASPAWAAPIGLPDTLAEGTTSFGFGNDTRIPLLDLEFGFTRDSGAGSTHFSLFDFSDLTEADEGRLLIATPLSTADFAGVAGLLTNGVTTDLFYSSS